MKHLTRARTPATSPSRKAVDRQVAQICDATIVQLRHTWRKLFRSEPPEAFGPSLLRQSIAHRLQEDTHGRLQTSCRRVLDQTSNKSISKNSGKLSLPLQIKRGSEFARTWKGKMYRVVVLSKGYSYAGQTYASLSEIAQLITGTRWNGPRFFGLRQKNQNG